MREQGQGQDTLRAPFWGHLQGNTQHSGSRSELQNSNFPPKISACPRGITWKQHSGISKPPPPNLAHTGSVCFEKNCKTSKQNVKRAALICKLGAEEEPSHKKANYLLTRFWLRCFSWHLRHRSYFEGLFAPGGAEQTAIPFPFGSKHPFAVRAAGKKPQPREPQEAQGKGRWVLVGRGAQHPSLPPKGPGIVLAADQAKQQWLELPTFLKTPTGWI